MPAKPTYLGAVASSAGQGLLTAAWIASGGLTIGQRRALRLTATAAGAAYGVIAARKNDSATTWTPGEGLMAEAAADGTARPRPNTAASAAVVALGLGMMIGRRQLEKRWLARLQRQGHEHPYRQLALRIGVLAIAGALPGRLMDAHRARQQST